MSHIDDPELRIWLKPSPLLLSVAKHQLLWGSMLADPFQFALYLAHLSQSSKTRAPVEETHQLAVVEDPADHPLVKQILADIKHISAQKTTKIALITPEILRRTYANLLHLLLSCLLFARWQNNGPVQGWCLGAHCTYQPWHLPGSNAAMLF